MLTKEAILFGDVLALELAKNKEGEEGILGCFRLEPPPV